MLDLAVATDNGTQNTTLVETNRGLELEALGWPHDCDFQLVAFDPAENHCEVVWAKDLAEDIGRALMKLEEAAPFRGRKPTWYRRLKLYAAQETLSLGPRGPL
ncbi:MAG: hypothetical protein ABSD20_03760 [Terriglobales bacterium]|jgi:hypothetical protein